jgi:hypothetical protein
MMKGAVEQLHQLLIDRTIAVQLYRLCPVRLKQWGLLLLLPQCQQHCKQSWKAL